VAPHLHPHCRHRFDAFTLAAALSAALATAAAGAEIHVVGTSPAPNAMAAAATTIRVDFDAPLDPATVSAASVRVFGRGSGAANGTGRGTDAVWLGGSAFSK